MGKKVSKPSELDASLRILVLHGKDRFQVLEWSKRYAEVLREQHGQVDEFYFDGETVELAVLLDELHSYGLMCQHKLVVLEKADVFLKPPKPTDNEPKPKRSAKRAALERYAAQPVEDASLVLRAETWRSGNLDKLVAKVGAVVKCEPPTDARAASWSVARCRKQYECEIEPAAAALLVERVGTDLARLDTELGKLAAFVGAGQPIPRQLVGELVGFSREEQVWSIQSAIASGEPREAVATLRELMEISRQPVELVSWAINDLLRKLHAASQMLHHGTAPAAVSKELKLWGESQRLIINAAGRLSPQRFAQLLQASIEGSRENRRGSGDPSRTLEAMTVLIADTIRSA